MITIAIKVLVGLVLGFVVDVVLVYSLLFVFGTKITKCAKLINALLTLVLIGSGILLGLQEYNSQQEAKKYCECGNPWCYTGTTFSVEEGTYNCSLTFHYECGICESFKETDKPLYSIPTRYMS